MHLSCTTLEFYLFSFIFLIIFQISRTLSSLNSRSILYLKKPSVRYSETGENCGVLWLVMHVFLPSSYEKENRVVVAKNNGSCQ